MQQDNPPKPPASGLYRNDPSPPPQSSPQPPVIVVRPPLSARERSFIMAGKMLRMTLRIIAYLIVFLLSSIGLTALVNENLRIQLLEPFMPYIGVLFGGM